MGLKCLADYNDVSTVTHGSIRMGIGGIFVAWCIILKKLVSGDEMNAHSRSFQLCPCKYNSAPLVKHNKY